MDENLVILCAASAGVGLVHTAVGPDHYLPFIAMARAGQWSVTKTAAVTLLCGVGHVFGSLAIAAVGIGIGWPLGRIEAIEVYRGDIAAWFLIAFGLTYAVWGLRRAYRHRPHAHWHTHVDGTVHSHEHRHEREHVHAHAEAGSSNLTPWVLFTIFLFGPCEPLIPLVMFPVAQGSLSQAIPVIISFSLATLAAMLSIVLIAQRACGRLWPRRTQHFGNVLAGGVVLASGVAIKLGL